jgi:hypothetical protein
MPIVGKNVEPLFVLGAHLAERTEDQDGQQKDESDGNVRGVKAHQGVVCGAEKIRSDRQTFVVDEMAPLYASFNQKNSPESKRDKPPETECTGLFSTERR